MPILRIILAALIGLSLAVMPVAAAMAKPMTAMEHCDKKGMGAKGMDDCPCCDKANACAAESCALKCFKTPCFIPTAVETFAFVRQGYQLSSSESIASSPWPPPSPPPRA